MPSEYDDWYAELREDYPDLPEMRSIDTEAIMRWLDRNPDAPPEVCRQVLMALDHEARP